MSQGTRVRISRAAMWGLGVVFGTSLVGCIETPKQPVNPATKANGTWVSNPANNPAGGQIPMNPQGRPPVAGQPGATGMQPGATNMQPGAMSPYGAQPPGYGGQPPQGYGAAQPGTVQPTSYNAPQPFSSAPQAGYTPPLNTPARPNNPPVMAPVSSNVVPPVGPGTSNYPPVQQAGGVMAPPSYQPQSNGYAPQQPAVSQQPMQINASAINSPLPSGFLETPTPPPAPSHVPQVGPMSPVSAPTPVATPTMNYPTGPAGPMSPQGPLSPVAPR